MTESNPTDGQVGSALSSGIREQIVRLADGRQVQLADIGPIDGRPVMALHGTPGSRLKFRGAHDIAAALGLRLIAPDRWGYGGTEAPSRPDLAGYGDDLAALADALGIGRFGMLAISGGGPFGAMAAARLGRRVTRIALVCPVGPMAGATPEGTSGFHRVCFNVLPRIPGGVRLVFAGFRMLLAGAPEMAIGVATARAARADRALLAEAGMRRQLAETFAAGLAGGSDGPVIDMTLFSRPWPVGLSPMAQDLPPQARVWIGTADRNVPLPAARRLAALIGASIIEKPDCGHYWIAREWREVLSWLAQPEHPPAP